MRRTPNEIADLDRVQADVFAGRGLNLERYAYSELNKGRTPDFKVLDRSGRRAGLCEVKSPRDDWLDLQIEAAAPGLIAGGLRDDPIFNRIQRHIEKAASQFEAVDPDGHLPRILAFVNHDKQCGLGDLVETVTGHFLTTGGEWLPTMVQRAAKIEPHVQRIDIFFWIDAWRPDPPRHMFTNADPDRERELRDLMQLRPVLA